MALPLRRFGTGAGCARELVKRLAGRLKHGILSGRPLPSSYRDIDIEGVDFDAVRSASHLFGRQDRAAGPRKGIQDDRTPTGTVFDRVYNQGRGLDGRVLNFVATPPTERIRPSVFPDIGSAPVAAP